MTYFEKWKDEIADISNANHSVAVVNGKPAICQTVDCKSCDFKDNVNCHYELLKWAASEYQEPAPKLTRREREFLECFNCKDKNAILRHVSGKLYVQNVTYGICEAEIYSEMFPFIEPGKAWIFTDLLKLEVEE